jgi:hypothetical protein
MDHFSITRIFSYAFAIQNSAGVPIWQDSGIFDGKVKLKRERYFKTLF